MLGLRYYACQRCETVFALPDPPTACGRCGAETVDELRPDTTAASYFAPVEQS